MPVKAPFPLSAVMMRGIAAVAAACLLLPTAATTATAKMPLPPRTLSSATIDAHLGYQAQDSCSPAAKPGAKALLKLLISAWGGSSSGISRGCGVGGRSEHKEGRALDWHMSVKNASQRKRVDAALRWITANNGEVALRLGVMYVIWNQHIWSVYYPELGWRKMASRGSATANHKDHVHISLSWDGAYKQTSWWTGVPITSPLNSRCGAPGARACLPTIGRAPGAWNGPRANVPSSFTPAPWVIPGVGGSPQVGILQRAVPGTWVPQGATVSYQWTSDGRPIPGANDATYLIGPEQVGHEVEVTVTATINGESTRKSSDNIADVYPGRITTPPPTIVGTPQPGSTLRADVSAWEPAPTRTTYAWLRDGKRIAGARADNYVVQERDSGHRLAVEVSGSRAGYVAASRISSAVQIGAAFASVAAPAISGEPLVGAEVTVSAGSWTPTAGVSYQWLANGTAIPGANAATFRPQIAQRGALLQVAVTGRRPGYATTTTRSANFGPIS